MKTPDEIKKGLECCMMEECFGEKENCPYTADPALCVGVMCEDALAYIKQLEEQIPRWIPVEERLPEKHQGVIVHCKDGYVTLMCYDGRDWSWNGKQDNSGTHWMPLPEPPKEV